MALVLTVKVGQKIHIGPDITISWVESHPKNSHKNQRSIAIEAPDNVKILKDELVDGPIDERKKTHGRKMPKD